VGAPRYPFASEHQVLQWGREDADALHVQMTERLDRLQRTS
jgi:hypothetical protein